MFLDLRLARQHAQLVWCFVGSIKMEEEASQEDTYFFVASLLLFLTSLLTNGIILAVTRKSTVFKDTGQARTVIRHTAVVDIFAALDCLMSALGYFDKRLITGNRVVCGLDAFRAGVSKSQAHNALILLALNRYFLVVQPQTCHRVFSKRMTLIYIACFWVISFMISIILRVLNHYPEYSSTFGSCFYSPNSVSGPVLFSFRVISVLLIVACYIGIYWRIRKQRNRMQQHKRQEKVAGSPPSLTMAQIRDTLRSERSSEQLDSRNPQADVKNASEVPSGSTSLECVSEYQPSNCEDRSESKKREYKKTEEASEENSAVENDTYYESTDTQASKSRRSADEIHAISFVNPESFFPVSILHVYPYTTML